MSRGQAIALAFFTVWPFLYMILFFCLIFGMMLYGMSGQRLQSPPLIFWIIFPLHIFTIFEMFGLLVVYMVHLFKTDRVPQDKKALWAVVLFLGHLVAMPVYWYFYIWPGTLPSDDLLPSDGTGQNRTGA